MEQHEIIETQKRIIDTISYGVQDAIIITDPNRIITHFNKAAEKLTDYNVIEVISRNIGDFLKLEDEDGPISIDKICPPGNFDIDGTVYEQTNLKLIPANHTEEMVNVRSVKVRGGLEVNLGNIIFIENTFAKSELERMKLDFVSMAEHVLRTPITIIRGYLSRLLEDKTKSKLDPGEVNYVNSAMASTNELLSLVQNLLNIAEFRKGEVKIEKIAISLEDLVAKVVNEFKLVANEKGLRVVFIPPLEKLPMIKLDISKIKIVLQNLIDNSIKYSNGGTIDISVIPVENDLQVAIKDSGRGIPAEFIPHLFTKFYRVKKALQMEYGMGLGLYISKKIIDAHGGLIWVESEDGVGSTFFFRLPLSENNLPEDF